MNTQTMTCQHVCVGTRFLLSHRFGCIEYYFGFERGAALVLRRKGGHYIGEVTDVMENGFELTIHILNKNVTIHIDFTETQLVSTNQ